MALPQMNASRWILFNTILALFLVAVEDATLGFLLLIATGVFAILVFYVREVSEYNDNAKS